MDPVYLRNATAADHERTEQTVNLMSDGLERAAYVATLARFYGFVKGWEQWAAVHAPASLMPELEQRKRSRMLEQDLLHFGEPLPEELYRPAFVDGGPAASTLLGSMYVLEGSTLGGQFIAAHVEKVLHLNRSEGSAFFAGYGDRTGSMWKQFKAVLAAVPDEYTDAVVAAAKQTFADFGTWMTAPLPQPAAAATHVLHG